MTTAGKPSTNELAKLAIKHGAPQDVAEYTWVDAHEHSETAGGSEAHVPIEHYINTDHAEIGLGWDEGSRHAAYSWEARGKS